MISVSRRTFSIPGRIELSATMRRSGHPRCFAAFQYPRSDRVVCNQGSGNRLTPWAKLSVSPVGSSCLQPLCTKTNHLVASSLSVSPVGSSCLQLQIFIPGCASSAAFQYPRSDRVVCNPGATALPAYGIMLSVSPVGSSCLQLLA